MILARWLHILGNPAAEGRAYGPADLRRDLGAGLTVALVLIPQSMAYAQLAGLPPYYGLYAAFLPPVVAALLGSSRQLATGPVAVVSLMTAATLEPLARQGSEAYVAYAIVLALVVGLFQLGLGVLRLGLVVNFISHPVVNGFTNAAALIIASSQLAAVLGVEVDRAPLHFQTVANILETAWNHLHWPTLAMALLALGIMLGIRRLNPRLPYVLIAVVLTTVISWGLDYDRRRTVPVGSLVDPQAAGLVQGYNFAMAQAAAHSAERDQAQAAMDRAEAGSAAWLEARHQVALQDLLIQRQRDSAAHSRALIRKLRFLPLPGAMGGASFGPAGERPPRDLALLWRLKVGSGPLDPEHLVLSSGGEVVGAVPSGLPGLAVPQAGLSLIWQLLPYAAIISLLGFMEAISVAKAMAAKTGQRLDPNRELVGQGLANLAGAFTGGYPVSGSFSRSAVNLSAGAVSGLSSLFTTLAVAVVLLFFTPLLYHLPKSVLAAVIMLAVLGLVNPAGFIHAWRAQWYDGAISLITFLATLAFAPHLDRGILLGAGLSLLVFLYQSMRPRVASLALGEDLALHDAGLHGLAVCRHVAVLRFEGPLFFANAAFLEDQVARLRSSQPGLKHFHLVCDGISTLDASGEQALALIVDRLRSAGFGISLSGVHAGVMEVMRRTHLLAKIGREHIYPTAAAALAVIHRRAHREGDEEACPLLEVCPRPVAGKALAG